jgi:hypothetical protein
VTTRLEMSRLEYVLDGSEEAFGGEELRDGLGTLAPWPGFLSLFFETATFRRLADKLHSLWPCKIFKS